MTEVLFYLSQDQGPDALFTLSRRLVQAARQRDRQVYVHCADRAQMEAFDRLLWCEPRSAFLPHSCDTTACPVQLGWQEVPANQCDVLINLAPAVPDFFSRFTRVAEPVSPQENERQAARARWKFYESRGYPVQKHDI